MKIEKIVTLRVPRLAKMSEMVGQMVHDKENAGNANAAPTEVMPQKASAADTVLATNAHAGGAAPSNISYIQHAWWWILSLQCVYLYYTPTHISTIPCCACSLHHRRTYAHTRTHAQNERERESRAGSKPCWQLRTYMCPHTTICVRILLYVCL